MQIVLLKAQGKFTQTGLLNRQSVKGAPEQSPQWDKVHSEIFLGGRALFSRCFLVTRDETSTVPRSTLG